MNAVTFKDCKCACEGTLCKVNIDGSKASDNQEVKYLKCNKCNTKYFISWDLDTGEPHPLYSKEDSIHEFMELYKSN